MKNKITLKFVASVSLLVAILGYSSYRIVKRELAKKYNAILVPDYSISETQGNDRVFAPNEHIILVDLKMKKFEPSQLQYHEGYQLKGITTDSDGTMAIYVNTEEVVASANGKKGSDYLYGNFGRCLSDSKDNLDSSSDYVDYLLGQHILAIPISKPKNGTQVIYHEGYSIEDVATYVFGRPVTYGGCYIIYTNNEPVRCKVSNEKGECLDFGIPISKEKVL